MTTAVEEQSQDQVRADEQAAFDATFAEPSREKPAPVVEEKPVQASDDAVKAAAAAAAAEADAKAAAEAEWAGVPPKMRQIFERIEPKLARIDEFDQRVKSEEGRAGAALKAINELKLMFQTAKDVKQAGGDAPTQEQIAAAAESDAEWMQLKEDFPDWAKGTEKYTERAIDAKLEKFRATLPGTGLDEAAVQERINKAVTKATSEATAKAREIVKVDQKYPAWEQDIYASEGGYSKEFAEWEAKQPPEVRALKTSNKAGDALKMLDGYYAHRKTVAEATAKAERNKARLESAIQPKGSGAPPVKTLSDDQAAQQAFEEQF